MIANMEKTLLRIGELTASSGRARDRVPLQIRIPPLSDGHPAVAGVTPT